MQLKQGKGFAKKAGKALQKASSTILSCIGAVGVIATAVLTAKATPKAVEQIKAQSRREHNGDPYAASKLEMVKSCWVTYAPAAITGIATIGCILGANTLNRRQQASLISAYAFLDRSFRQYKHSVKNVFGEEGHKRVLENIATERVDPDHTVRVLGAWQNSTLDFNVIEEEHLFYDSFSDRHFTSTIGKILQAEYHLNRTFAVTGGVTLNEFYTFLGLNTVDGGDDIGWWVDYENEYYWVDFNHAATYLDDGLDRPQVECLIIEFIDPPHQPWPDME